VQQLVSGPEEPLGRRVGAARGFAWGWQRRDGARMGIDCDLGSLHPKDGPASLAQRRIGGHG
jgi:hypothetical protein